MSSAPDPIPFASSTLGKYRHVCAFFNSANEEYQTLLPFIRDGLQRGERAFHVLPSRYRDEHLGQLREAGIDVVETQKNRQLEVTIPEETYLRGGRFDKDEMLALIQDALKAGTTLGFPLTRLIAHAETVLEDWPSINEWVEYEMRLNDVLPGYDDPVICTYDANLLNGSLAMDILRTHPVAVIGGVVCENPFFTQPKKFLREVERRRATPPSPYRA
jgi:hypothetical protein